MYRSTLTSARRTALALACLGTTLTAQAQAVPSVAFYGSLGEGVELLTNQTGGGSVTKVSSNPLVQTFIGFRGREDLGGGLSSLFVLESNVDASVGALGAKVNGSNAPFNRNAYVGLESNGSGRLTLGRQWLSLVDLAIEQLDVFNVAGPNAFTVPIALLGSNRYQGYDTDASNSVKWRYGGAKGFGASASYGLGGVAGSNTQGSEYSFAVQQSGQNYNLGAGYMRFISPSLIASTGADPSQSIWAVGGNMTFGTVKPYFSYYNANASTLNAALTNIVDKVYAAGISWNLAPVLLRAGYYADKGSNLDGVAGRNGSKNSLVLGAEYWLSKRSNLYFAFANNALSGGYALDPVYIAALGRNPSASSVQLYSVGFNQRF